MKIIIVGCGRVGTELAESVSAKGHEVVVIDDSKEALERLSPAYRGRTLEGSGIDRRVLLRAEIDQAEAVAAVTSSDNINIVVSRIAKEIYGVPIVVARTYNPHRLSIYERLGLQTIASSSWGARRIEEMMTSPQCASRLTLGHGDVEIVEVRVPAAWQGRSIGDLAQSLLARPVAVTRGGRARMAEPDFALQEDDLLYLAVQAENLPRVNTALAEGRS